jgi:hypothetical protein
VALKPKISKEKLEGLINALQKNPNDKVRLLGDVGIVSISASGAPLASVAAIAGVKSIFGMSFAAQIFGWAPALLLTGLPLTLLIGFASVFGLLGYSLAQMVRNGGAAEGHKAALLEQYRLQVKEVEAAEQSASITDADRTQFIISLRELINADAIPIASAFRMIEMVEAGRMPLSQAIAMSKACMETKPPK